MSYKLGLQGKGINAVRDLSSEEWENYSRASKNLYDFSGNQRLFTMVLLNYGDFVGILKKYREDYARNPAVNQSIMEQMILNVNRYLLNFLSSVRSYLDHTNTNLNRKYGEKSERYLNFARICSKKYYESFSYRFMFKLRNYAQHCGMPIEDFSLSSAEEPPYSGHIIHRLEIKFDRDKLLRFDSWGAQVRQELSQLADKFEVLPHVIEMLECLKDINFAVIKEDLPELTTSAIFIEKLVSPLKGKEGTPCILQFSNIQRDTNSEVKSMKVTITHIPFHLTEYALGARVS